MNRRIKSERKYMICNGSCRGVFCYGNQTWKFNSKDDARKGIKWLGVNQSERIKNPFYIVEVNTNRIVSTVILLEKSELDTLPILSNLN